MRLRHAWSALFGLFCIELIIVLVVSLGIDLPRYFAGFTQTVMRWVPSIHDYETAMSFSSIAAFILSIMWALFPLKLFLFLFAPFQKYLVGKSKREEFARLSKGTNWGMFVAGASNSLHRPPQGFSSGRSAVLGEAIGSLVFAFFFWFLGPTDLPASAPTSVIKPALSAWVVVGAMSWSPLAFWAIHAMLACLEIFLVTSFLACLFVFLTRSISQKG